MSAVNPHAITPTVYLIELHHAILFVLLRSSLDFLANVRRHPPLPVVRSVPGAKRPSTERDAGRGWLDGIVRIYCFSGANDP